MTECPERAPAWQHLRRTGLPARGLALSVPCSEGNPVLPLQSTTRYDENGNGLLHTGRMPDTLGHRIRAARESAGLTQQDVAHACGISRNAVSMWESADANGTKPTVQNLNIVLGLLKDRTGCSVREIAGWMLDEESSLLPPWLSRRLESEPNQSTGNIPNMREDLLLAALQQVDIAIEQHAPGQRVPAEVRARMIATAYADLVLFENSKSKISSKLKSLVTGS